VDLSGGLSNHPLQDLLQCLTASEARKEPAIREKANAGWPDGRRKFGTVAAAVVTVLSTARTEMPVKAIRAEVEQILDGRVSRYSVSDFLLTRSKGAKPLFERTRHGHYRLLPR